MYHSGQKLRCSGTNHIYASQLNGNGHGNRLILLYLRFNSILRKLRARHPRRNSQPAQRMSSVESTSLHTFQLLFVICSFEVSDQWCSSHNSDDLIAFPSETFSASRRFTAEWTWAGKMQEKTYVRMNIINVNRCSRRNMRRNAHQGVLLQNWFEQVNNAGVELCSNEYN